MPKDWRNVVDKCSAKFHVVSVTREIILDFKTTLAPFYKAPTNSGKIKWCISKYRRFNYVRDSNVVTLSASVNHNGPLTDFTIEKNEKKAGNRLLAPQLYQTDLQLNPKKYEDVMTLARKYIPPSDMDFYDNISSGNCVQEAEESDFEAS